MARSQLLISLCLLTMISQVVQFKLEDGGNATPTALNAKSAEKLGALVNSIEPYNTGRIPPGHLHIDQVHEEDSSISHGPSQIASSSGSVEPQIASDCLTLNSAMSRPSSAPHFSLQNRSDKADVQPRVIPCVKPHAGLEFERSLSGSYAPAHGSAVVLAGIEIPKVHSHRPHLSHTNLASARSSSVETRPEESDHGNDDRIETGPEESDHGNDDSIETGPEESDHGGDDPIESGPEASEHGNGNPIETGPEASEHGNGNPIETGPEASEHGNWIIETGPEASEHGNGNPIETRLLNTNAIVAQVTGQAVVNLMAYLSPDSPFLRFFALSAACGFVGSLYAISRLKNRKVAKYLTKFSAICLLFAVSIAVGVNVLGGTNWHLNIVVTVALCVASVALVARADI